VNTKTSPARDARRQLLRAALALPVLAAFGVFPRRAEAVAAKVGKAAPPAVLVTLDGQRFETRQLLGRVVILTFWATWCAPCRKELPILSEYAKAHADQGLTVLGFALDDADQREAVRKVAASLAFPVGFLLADSAPGYGRIWRMPANFTIGRDGVLLDNAWEDTDAGWSEERLERIVAPHLSPT
jgi:thiol-disulfide isomerase/thioredoxin